MIFHQPVLLDEVVRSLVTDREGIYIDGTLGGAGHTKSILKALGREGRLLGIDRDSEALEKAKSELREFTRVSFLHGTYDDLERAMEFLGTDKVDGLLLDLGLSSLQLDQPSRGFSFRQEGALDMRFDPTEGITAAEVIADRSENELERIFREYGEEPFARRIARRIVEARRNDAIETTLELASLVAREVPRRSQRIHPATKIFQALRIFVNQELERLERFLGKAPQCLRPGGRLVVLSYHSLEDRRVKQAMVQWGREGVMKRITKKAIRPGLEEIEKNPRSRSVRMRVGERMGE